MISQFAGQLVSLDYKVIVTETPTDSPLTSGMQPFYDDKIVYTLYAIKDTGATRRNRRVGNGGYVLIREDGHFRFDFYVGGDKYGIHKTSYEPDPSFECWSKDFPVDLLLDFLS